MNLSFSKEWLERKLEICDIEPLAKDPNDWLQSISDEQLIKELENCDDSVAYAVDPNFDLPSLP